MLSFTEPINTTGIIQYNIFRDGIGVGAVPVGSISFLDIGLTPATTYSYFLISRTIDSMSIPSNTLSGTTSGGGTVPDPPVLITATANGATGIDLVWTEPADTSGITQYNIYRDSGSGFLPVTSVPVGTTFLFDFGLTPATTYSYYVTSRGVFGESVPSNIESATTGSGSTDPPILDGVSAFDPTTIELRWFEPIDTSQITQYNIYRDSGLGFELINSVPVGINSLFDFGLTPATTYSYYVTSRGIFGESIPSNIVSATTSTGVIEPPILITATAFNQFTIELIWAEPADVSGIIQYEIFRGFDGIEFFHIGSQPVGSTSFFDLGLSPNTTYHYQILARGNFGQSIFSNIVSGTTETTALSEPPFIIDGFTDGANTITIRWIEPFDTTGVTFYEIERRVSGFGDFESVGSVPTGTTAFTEVVASSTIFEYRIRSTSGDGVGFPSNIFVIASSVNPILLNSTGFTIEPEVTNSFDDQTLKIFSQTAEIFVSNQTIIDNIISDIEVERLNAFEIIIKMTTGQYGTTSELSNLGAFYGTNYISFNNVTEFIDQITDKARLARGGTNGAGDNPEHGEIVVGDD